MLMNLELLRFIIGTVVLAAGLLTFAMEMCIRDSLYPGYRY